MAGIDIKRFLSSFGQNYHPHNVLTKGTFNAPQMPAVQPTPQQSAKAPDIPTPTPAANTTQNLAMPQNTPQSQAVFAKDVLGFPKNANEFIYMVQRGMTQTQFNQMFANQMLAQRTNISQMQAQILAQLQGLDTSTAKEMINAQLSSQVQGSIRNLEILSNGMINLNQVAMLFQKNGKEAITKLIMSMTEAAKAGITDVSQLKEMAKFINASVSIAAENNPQKTLKLLLMLYLPWLPLEDGVDFDLEVQQSENKEEGDSILTITITTINYGIVRATIFLESSNSVQVVIECGENFPKTELKARIAGEQKHYSMDSVMSFDTRAEIKEQQNVKQSANINMSQTNEINPYLLLMAHSIIKNVIEIDNNKTQGISSHPDYME
jgi:hypothetical protein